MITIEPVILVTALSAQIHHKKLVRHSKSKLSLRRPRETDRAFREFPVSKNYNPSRNVDI